MKPYLILFLVYFLMSGCKKELSLENQPQTQPESKFQLKAFYSDIPIDFDEFDNVVKEETDLWVYVHEYLKDDTNIFSWNTNSVSILQNSIKKTGLEDAVLLKQFEIFSNAEGTFMKFLSPEYESYIYTLTEMNDNFFILSTKWKDKATVYSRFERVD